MLLRNKNSTNKYDMFLLIIIIFLIINYYFSFYTYNLPLKYSGYDTYNHLGILRTLENELGAKNNLKSGLFPSLYSDDPHIGTNFIGMFLISSVLGTNNVDTLFLFGILNIIFFFTSFYTFVYQYLRSNKIALISVIIIMIFTSAHSRVSTGFFSIDDIIITAHYPKIFASSVALLLLSLNVRYLKFQQKKLLILQFILVFVLFTSHMLTLFIYIIVLFLLLITDCLKTKKIEKKIITSVVIILIVPIVATFWPFYNWVDIFIQSQPIQTKAPPVNRYSYEWVVDGLRLYDLGAIVFLFGGFFLIKKRDIFLLLWVTIFFIISLSFILPFRPPLYWRFVPFVKVPIIIGFSEWLTNNGKHLLSKTLLIFVIPLMIISITTGFEDSVIPLVGMDDASVKYTFLSQFDEKNKAILTYNPIESYLIQGIMRNFSVLVVPKGHSDVFLWPELEKRYEEIQNTYESNDNGKWNKLIEKYNIDYVLLNKYSKKYNYSVVRTLLDGTVEYSDNSFELIKLNYKHGKIND